MWALFFCFFCLGIVRFVEPFEQHGTDATLLSSYWTGYDSTGKTLQPGRLGGSTKALRLTTDALCHRDVGSNVAVCRLGFWYKVNALSTGVNFIAGFVDGSTLQCCLRLSSSGQLGFFRGAATSLAVSTNTLSAGVWNHIEVQSTIHNTTGTYEVRVNRSSVGWIPPVTGANTRSSANNFATRFELVDVPSGFTAYSREYDDIIFSDSTGTTGNTFLGDKRLEWIQPDGAGASTQWTPSSGSNYDRVNNTPPVDTEYVADATVGHRDTYTLANTSAVNVSHVTALHRAFKSGSGASSIKRVLTSGATVDVESVAQVLSTTPQLLDRHYPVDPNGSIPWTPAAVNALEGGQEFA